jgi:predicted PurR-regulated permease PerM
LGFGIWNFELGERWVIMSRRGPVATGVLIALTVIGILLVLWLIRRLSSVVVILILATLLATGIGPIIDRLTGAALPPRGWHLPKSAAVILVYLCLVIVIAAIVLVIGTVVVNEGVQFAKDAPRYLTEATNALNKLHDKHPSFPSFAGLLARVRDQLGVVSSYVYQALTKLFGFLGNIVVIVVTFVIAYYLLSTEQSAKEGILRLIPPSKREEYGETFAEMGSRMGAWLRGQLLLAFIVGVVIGVGLAIIGLPYAGIIAIVGAVAEMIPMLGPGVAAIPAVLIALVGPPWKIAVVIVFFVVLSQVESNILFPKVMKHAVGLNPIVTILALLAGAALAGFMGALLAIPLTAAGQVFYQQIILPAIEKAEHGK